MLGQFIISLYTRQLSTPKDIYCHAFLYFQNLLQHLSCWRQPQILKVLAVTITSYEVTINMKLVTTTIISIFQTQVWRSQKNWCQCQTSHWQSYSLNIRILTPNTILFLLTGLFLPTMAFSLFFSCFLNIPKQFATSHTNRFSTRLWKNQPLIGKDFSLKHFATKAFFEASLG